MLKKVITQLLILLMLLPAWVCAMPACEMAMSQQQAMSSMSHCEGVEHNQTDELMLFADCMQVELQQAYYFQNIVKSSFDTPSTDTIIWYTSYLGPLSFKQITALIPPEQKPPSFAQTIYLSTLRIRV